MGGRLFDLDRQALGTVGVASAALALMAWPHARQDSERLDWQSRLTRALQLMDAVPSGEVLASDPLASEAKTVWRLFRSDTRLNKAIRGSLDLGHLAMPWLKRANDGDTTLLPSMSELTKAALQRALVEARGQHIDPSNFNRSQWDPWLPAVHLAAAMRIVMQAGERTGTDVDYRDILRNQRLLKWWLELAEEIEPVAERVFPEITDTIVRVRMT